MEKGRLEKVLGRSLTKDDMKYIRIYYLRFYNEPEKYSDSTLVRLILDDLSKDTSPVEEITDSSGEVDITGMPYPNVIRHQEHYLGNERDLLWLAFEEHEWRLGCCIKNINIEWFLNIVRSVFKSYGTIADESKLNTLKKYWNEASSGYAKLGLLDDYQAYQDCMLEMFQRYDKGENEWDLNDSIKWKVDVYEAFVADVLNQITANHIIYWELDETFRRVKSVTGYSGIEMDEYYGSFECAIRNAKLDYNDLNESIRRGDKLTIDDVKRLFDSTFRREIDSSIHYDWRYMVDQLDNGVVLTFEDVKKYVLEKVIKDIQKVQNVGTSYNNESNGKNIGVSALLKMAEG